MPFNRKDAVDYARKHWNIPCHDGVVWLTDEAILIEAARKKLGAPASDGWEARFVKGDGTDPEKLVFQKSGGGEQFITGWAGLADCAHYLSCCLTAGGAKVSELGVGALVKKLQERLDTKTLCERVSRDAAQRVIDTGILKEGDMIGYFNVSPQGDYDGRLAYAHSTMYVGKVDAQKIGGVTCHTVARFPPLSWYLDSWFLGDKYSYTLIHFAVDDPVPDPAKAKAIEGWWRLEYSGRTEYYLMSSRGSARYTKKAPKAAADPMHAPEGSAYWFMAADKSITFTWRRTGTVEVWTPGPGNSYSSKINGATPGVLTKLF